MCQWLPASVCHPAHQSLTTDPADLTARVSTSDPAAEPAVVWGGQIVEPRPSVGLAPGERQRAGRVVRQSW
jgi:hypothetical protein